jgi:hypothetical protein
MYDLLLRLAQFFGTGGDPRTVNLVAILSCVVVYGLFLRRPRGHSPRAIYRTSSHGRCPDSVLRNVSR